MTTRLTWDGSVELKEDNQTKIWRSDGTLDRNGRETDLSLNLRMPSTDVSDGIAMAFFQGALTAIGHQAMYAKEVAQERKQQSDTEVPPNGSV